MARLANYDEFFQTGASFQPVPPVVKPTQPVPAEKPGVDTESEALAAAQAAAFVPADESRPVQEPAQGLVLDENADPEDDPFGSGLKFEKDRPELVAGGGAAAPKPSDKSAPVPLADTRVTSDKMVRVEIHKELFDVIKSFVIGGSNKQEIMEAFICAWAAGYVPVPNEVKDLIPKVKIPRDKTGEGLDSLQGMSKRMLNRMTQQDSDLAMLKTCMAWLIAERMGCDVNRTSDPDKMDFVFREHDAILRQVFGQVTQHEAAKKRRVGRAIGEKAMIARNGG